MNPSSRLKWASVFFAVFWIVAMLWWSGSFDRAHIAITAVSGVVLGYAWYRFMRWWLSRTRLAAQGQVSDGTEAKS